MKSAADPPGQARQGQAAGARRPAVAGRARTDARVVEVDVSPAAYNDWHIDGAVLWDVYRDPKDAATAQPTPRPFSGSSRAQDQPAIHGGLRVRARPWSG
jgi:hypothetical protein